MMAFNNGGSPHLQPQNFDQPTFVIDNYQHESMPGPPYGLNTYTEAMEQQQLGQAPMIFEHTHYDFSSTVAQSNQYFACSGDTEIMERHMQQLLASSNEALTLPNDYSVSSQQRAPRKNHRTDKHPWNKPVGAMPECLLYIWPDRAPKPGVNSKPALSTSFADYSPRKVAENLQCGHTLLDMVSTVQDAPPRQVQNITKGARKAESGTEENTMKTSMLNIEESTTKTEKIRTNNQTKANCFSRRNCNWRVTIGIFPHRARLNNNFKQAANIYDVLKYCSIAQLFHGVIGHIDKQTWTMTPPRDFMHTGDESNKTAQYPVSCPQDVPATERGCLAKRGLVLPSFTGFLYRNQDTYQKFKHKLPGQIVRQVEGLLQNNGRMKDATSVDQSSFNRPHEGGQPSEEQLSNLVESSSANGTKKRKAIQIASDLQDAVPKTKKLRKEAKGNNPQEDSIAQVLSRALHPANGNRMNGTLKRKASSELDNIEREKKKSRLEADEDKENSEAASSQATAGPTALNGSMSEYGKQTVEAPASKVYHVAHELPFEDLENDPIQEFASQYNEVPRQ